jgi:FkbM family methyltransferase
MKLSPKTEKTLKAVLGSYIVVQILFTAGFAAHPPVGAAALVMIGRGPACGLKESMQAFYRGWSMGDRQQSAFKASKLIRKEDGMQLVSTPWGEIWEPETVGTAAVAQIAEIEAKYAGFPGQPILKGDIVLDCGANVGVETLYALRLGAGKVIAIEPSPVNVAVLRKNFAKEIAEGRVVVYPKGVWDKDDVLELHLNDDTTAMDSFLIKREHSSRVVKAELTTIDKIVAELKLDRVDFIKMDTEGAEKKALEGGRQTIAKFKPRMEISVDHLPEDPEQVPVVARSINAAYNTSCLVCAADWKKWKVNSTILFFE